MKFVLQNATPQYDFQCELERQKEFYRWLNQGKDTETHTELIVCTEKELKNVCPDTDLKQWCPVGSIEFCVRWYKDVWGITPLPKNVPDELIPLCHRKIMNMEKDSYTTEIADPSLIGPKLICFSNIPGDRIFRKDTREFKSCWNGVKDKDIWGFHDGDHRLHTHFQVSELLTDITSEWRCFVFNGQLMDIKCYNGNPFDMPTKEYVERLITAYKSAPVAYTLDMAQTNLGTEVIEVHDFFACGLYGFSDTKYPFMLWRWFKEFTKSI